jgi:hypothetical protein
MGDIYSVGCIRKRQHETMDRPVKLKIGENIPSYRKIYSSRYMAASVMKIK